MGDRCRVLGGGLVGGGVRGSLTCWLGVQVPLGSR